MSTAMMSATTAVMAASAATKVMAAATATEVMSAPAEATAMHFRSFVVLGLETAASAESTGIAMIAKEVESAGMRGPA
jgi:hypothetical protein